MEIGVWSQTGGAGTPHSVQRRLQVAAPPQHGSRERNKEEKGNRDGGKMYKDRGWEQRCQEGEVVNNVREPKDDKWEEDKRVESEKKEDNVR